MKKIYYLYAVSVYATLLVVVLMMSCSDMDESFQHYLDEGENIYAARVDSVAPHTGKNRMMLEMFVKSYRISTVRVFWNDYADSVDFAIEGPGVYERILENMEERSYIFQLVSLDEFGNKSLPVELSAFVYGDRYQARLLNRPIRSASVDILGKVTISWADADISGGAIASEIKYTDLTGATKIQNIPADETTTILADIKPGTTFAYSTMYKPDSASIDVFNTNYAPGPSQFTFDKKDWQIIDFSSNHGGNDNKVENFIDGTDKTRWHSCAGCSSYPHYATIDMGATRTIARFGLWITTFENPDGDNRAPDKIELLVSPDNTTYTSLGVFDFNRFRVGEQTYDIPSQPQARYFKFVAVSGPVNDQMVMGEISAYGF